MPAFISLSLYLKQLDSIFQLKWPFNTGNRPILSAVDQDTGALQVPIIS